MSLPEKTTVLVVGAGPAGMACALSLRSQGVTDITIVDAVDQGDHSSRAMVIHAATLEALDSIGCADEIVAQGIQVPSMEYFDRKSLLLAVDFESLDPYTKFPYYVLLPQHITEKILGEKLQERGIHVHRPYKVVGMSQASKNGRAVDVTFENGKSIQAQYVVGADGAQSAVRQLSGVGFADPAATPDKPVDVNTLAQMVIADVTFSKPPTLPNILFGVVTRESFFIFSPLQYPMAASKETGGKTVYRIACGVPLTSGAPPSHPSVDYVQDLIESYGPDGLSSKPSNPNAVSVSDVVWSTRFRTRCAVAERFFTYFGDDGSGKPGAIVCLIGDAAHVHPPAGGQGMNLGLRDAVTLGPVIAASIMEGHSVEADGKVKAHMALRRKRATDVIAMTKIMSGAVGMSPSLRDAFAWSPIHIYTIRDWVVWALGKSSWIRRTMAYKFSGLGAI